MCKDDKNNNENDEGVDLSISKKLKERIKKEGFSNTPKTDKEAQIKSRLF